MKAFISLIILFLTLGSMHAQTDTPEYHQRLYYTCKIWGYAKYFHQNLGSDNINWDEALLNTIDKVKRSTTNELFHESLISMLELAGEFQTPYGDLPEVPSTLRRNIDLSWFDDLNQLR